MKFYSTILQPVVNILDPLDKRKGVWIVILMALNALLDFFSLASFLPLVVLILNPDFIVSNKYFNAVYLAFGFSSTHAFIIAITALVFVFIVLKSIAGFWITRSKANYCFAIGSHLSSRMLNRFMEISYLKFTQTDFTKELNRIANSPIAFANNIILPLTNLISESLVFIILLFCIAFYDAKVFVLLLIILTPVGLVYMAKRKNLSMTSANLKAKYPLTLKYALQLVEGLIDIKVFGRESFFKNRFNKASLALAKTFSQDHTNQTSASRLTEIIAGLIICSLIIYSVLVNQNYQQTILMLGIYAGASFRMIPSLNRILNAFVQIKSYEFLFAELDVLANFQPIKNQEQSPSLEFTTSIGLKNISFHYPNGAEVLRHASITIHKGDKVALIGKSGSGKTTIMMLLLQFLKGSFGKILLDEIELSENDLVQWRKIFSYVPQSPYILDGTIAENIAFGIPANEINHEKIMQLIKDLSLEEMIDKLHNGLSTQIGEKGIKLSGGQRQRIAIARALYANTEVLLFDEITNQLDAQTENEIIQVLEKIKDQKKTILMITHHAHLFNWFDRILTLENGLIVEKPRAQRQRP